LCPRLGRGERVHQIGLVDDVVRAAPLSARVNAQVQTLLKNAPRTMRWMKQVVDFVARYPDAESLGLGFSRDTCKYRNQRLVRRCLIRWAAERGSRLARCGGANWPLHAGLAKLIPAVHPVVPVLYRLT